MSRAERSRPTQKTPLKAFLVIQVSQFYAISPRVYAHSCTNSVTTDYLARLSRCCCLSFPRLRPADFDNTAPFQSMTKEMFNEQCSTPKSVSP